MTSGGIAHFLHSRLARVRRDARLLRLTPFDTETEEGRSRERYRRTALSALASIAAKAIAVLATIVSVPLTLGYLGAERFGIWMTLSALVSVLSFTDLGIGNSLLNGVAHAAGRGDRASVHTYVSSGMAMLVVVALGVGLLLTALWSIVPWASLFNSASPGALDGVGLAGAALVASFLVGMPVGALPQVRVALQQGYVNSIFVGVGNVAGLALVLVAIQMQLDLVWLVLAVAGAPVLAAAVNGLTLVARSPWLRPNFHDVQLPVVRSLLRVGVLFLVLQLAFAVAFTSNTIIAGVVIGPTAVAEYAVVWRLFLIPQLVVGFALSPLWPAYREALSRGDSAWVRTSFIRSVRLSLVISGVTSALLVLVGLPVIDLWLGTTSVRPPFELVLAMGVWTPINALGTAIAMLLNAAQVLRFQLVVAVVMATGNVALSVFLASTIGVAGVVWGSVIAFSFLELVPVAVYLPRLLDRIERGPLEAER